jgi:hypothetical protein
MTLTKGEKSSIQTTNTQKINRYSKKMFSAKLGKIADLSFSSCRYIFMFAYTERTTKKRVIHERHHDHYHICFRVHNLVLYVHARKY